jgi:solute carrier family 25 carnitine/acylcarnitine transporter 20/29
MSEHGIEFFCGCMSGWAQVLTMQPFEIIKVRLANQSLLNPVYQGITDCFRQIYQQEGVSAFYRGTLSPLLGIGAQVALQFGTNELVKKLMLKLNADEELDGTRSLPMNLILLSGIITGIPSSLVITPVDHTRIKMQGRDSKKYKGSVHAGIQIYKKYGLNGLYQGFYPTILREVIALGVYFSTYESLSRHLNK